MPLLAGLVILIQFSFAFHVLANLTIAKAQAEALRVQNAAIAQNKDVLELRRIEVEKIEAEKWDGALPTAIYAGAPIPFLNVGR
jgi:prohibitin 2